MNLTWDEGTPDESLAALAKAGDQSACDYLMDKFKPLVRSVTRPYFLVGGDREDLIQEGMIGLYKAIQTYAQDKQVPFAGFAEICVRRQVVSAVRTATRRKHTPLNNYVSIHKFTDEEDEPQETEDALEYSLLTEQLIDPEEIIIDRENSELLRDVVDHSLSPMERKVLELYMGGASYGEIARKLGKEEKSIDNALQRIRRKLRTVLR